MTRRPSEFVPGGFDGPPYQENLICAEPSCTARATERHHIWRRSLLGAPYSWVRLPDGSEVCNLVRFCHGHHSELSDDRAEIGWGNYGFVWATDTGSLPLSFQPPHVLGAVEFENAGEKSRANHNHRVNECPACGQALPKPKIESPSEPKRIRRSWTVTVPADHRENGAETLDTLLEEARVELDKAGLSYGDERSTRFFVLATILGLFCQHFDELVSE